MGVRSRGETGVGVTQVLGQFLDGHTLCQQRRSVTAATRPKVPPTSARWYRPEAHGGLRSNQQPGRGLGGGADRGAALDGRVRVIKRGHPRASG